MFALALQSPDIYVIQNMWRIIKIHLQPVQHIIKTEKHEGYIHRENINIIPYGENMKIQLLKFLK